MVQRSGSKLSGLVLGASFDEHSLKETTGGEFRVYRASIGLL